MTSASNTDGSISIYANGDNDDDDETVWIAPPFCRSSCLQQSLRGLEQELRCPVCQDYFNSPVAIQPCQHSFCSRCIHTAFQQQLRSLSGQSSCPVCRTAVNATRGGTDLTCLVPNRTVELLVQQYRQRVRAPLLAALRQQAAVIGNSTAIAQNSTSAKSECNADSVDATSIDTDTSSRKKKDLRRKYDNTTDFSQQQQQQQQQQQRPAKKQRVMYSRYTKKKELQQLCRQEGLSTFGPEHQLRDRHERFIVYWNAACDSFLNKNRDTSQWVTEFNRQENARMQSQQQHAHVHQQVSVKVQQLATSTRTVKDPQNATSGDPNFDRQIRSNYAKLIAQEKLRQQELRQSRQSQNSNPTKEEQEREVDASCITNVPRIDVDNDGSKEYIPAASGSSSTNRSTRRRGGVNYQYDNNDDDDDNCSISDANSHSPPLLSLAAKTSNEIRDLSDDDINRDTRNSVHDTNFDDDDEKDQPEVLNRQDDTMLPSDGVHNDVTGSAAKSTANTLSSATTTPSANKAHVDHDHHNQFHDSQCSSHSGIGSNRSGNSPENRQQLQAAAADAAAAGVATITSSSIPTPRSLIGPWTCVACTYYNTMDKSSRARCAMCRTPRPHTAATIDKPSSVVTAGATETHDAIVVD